MPTRNVTITLDEDVARWVRIRAAGKDTSISRLVGEMLREQMLDERTYQIAQEKYLARSPQRLKHRTSKYPRRNELYDRPGVR